MYAVYTNNIPSCTVRSSWIFINVSSVPMYTRLVSRSATAATTHHMWPVPMLPSSIMETQCIIHPSWVLYRCFDGCLVTSLASAKKGLIRRRRKLHTKVMAMMATAAMDLLPSISWNDIWTPAFLHGLDNALRCFEIMLCMTWCSITSPQRSQAAAS